MEMNQTIPENELLRICKSRSMRASDATTPCTASEFVNAMQHPEVSRICRALAPLPHDDAHKKERDRLKGQLPVFCFNAARFDNNHRSNQEAHPSGLSMFDIDLVNDPRALYEQLGGDGSMKACGVVLAHISCSGHGLHLVHTVRPGESIKQAQERFARNMGIDNWDRGACELARCSFVVPSDYVLYVDPDLLLAKHAPAESPTSQSTALTTATTTASAAPSDGIEEVEVYEEVNDREEALRQANAPMPVEPRYEGVPLKQLASAIITDVLKLDHAPQEGERNNAYLALQSRLRYFCGDNVQQMLDAAPDWGLSLEERRRVCQSAIHYEYKLMPRTLTDLLYREKTRLIALSTPRRSIQMPKRAPRLMQLLFKIFPKHLHSQVAIAMLPMLGTLTTALHYRKTRYQEMRTTVLTYVVGPMASGKGFVDILANLLLPDFFAEDKYAEAIESRWSAECALDTGRGPKRPHVRVRRIYPDFTEPGLVNRYKMANGVHLLCLMTESDSFRMTTTISAKLRDSYDGVQTGQTRATGNAVSGGCKGHMNFLACGTHSAMHRMFKSPEDGLVSRLHFIIMPKKEGYSEPVYGELTEREEQELAAEVHRLYRIGIIDTLIPDEEGGNERVDIENDDYEKVMKSIHQPSWNPIYIKLPRTESLIRDWTRMRAAEINAMPHQQALEAFTHRIPDFMRRIGMILYAVEGMHETDQMLEWVMWYADTLLQNTLDLYGSAYEEILHDQSLKEANYNRHPLAGDILDCLNGEFTLEDAMAKRRELGINATESNTCKFLSRALKNGQIEVIGTTPDRKKIYRKVTA